MTYMYRVWHRSTALSHRTLTLALLALFAALATSAQTAPPGSHAHLALISDINHAADPILSVGILFKLDPGWHVYWQNAGDSGEPPRIQWTLSPGLTAGPISWPQPTRLGQGSVIDYGYENQVLLRTMISRHKADPAGPLPQTGSINVTVKYVVCREICIPATSHLNLSLADTIEKTAPQSESDELFRQARAQTPKPAPTDWKIVAASQKDTFILWVKTKTPVQAATFFPLEPNQIENSAAQSFSESADGFRLTLRQSDQLMKPPFELKGVLVLGNGSAYEVTARVTPRQQKSTKPGITVSRLSLRSAAAPQLAAE
jgi:DsbC/DsbD-like thiol-disulfide interchange protein